MSAQTLNARSTRRLEAIVGVPLARAWGHGEAALFKAVTVDHRHLVINRRTQTWEQETEPLHYSSCHQMFPEPEWQKEERARVALLHQPFHRPVDCLCGQP